MQTLTLDKLAIGQKATITTVGGEGILRRRFLDMGLTPKTKVMVRKKAPLGDPIEIFLRGYELTLSWMTPIRSPLHRRNHEPYLRPRRQPKLRQKHTFQLSDRQQSARRQLPGVTVQKKEGRLLNNKDVTVIDLPGIYSLFALYLGRNRDP